MDLGYIESLYDEYHYELLKLKPIQAARYRVLGKCQFDDIECEILYMLIRDKTPLELIEFSPLNGWSTSWILEALDKNGCGRLTSYDIQSSSFSTLNSMADMEPLLPRWKFVLGDVQNFYKTFDFDKIDFLFIDCVHTDEFCRRYVEEVLKPAIGKDVTCVIHDIFSTNFGEGKVVIDFLEVNKILHETAAIGSENRHMIDHCRETYGLDTPIHSSQKNPSVFFNL